MRILHIIPTYYPAFRHGGPIESVHAINSWLVKLGAEVTVYTTNTNGSEVLSVPFSQEVDVNGVKVWYFPVSFKPWEHSREMKKMLSKTAGDFDLIHITSTFRSASTLGSRYAKKFRKPYIISPRGNLMREPLQMKSRLKKQLYLSLVEKKNLHGAAAIHFTVDRERDEYIATGLPLRRGIIIPNPYDPPRGLRMLSAGQRNTRAEQFRKKHNIRHEERIILFLSRVSWKKGLDTLIPAFHRMLSVLPDLRLVIAGGDEERYMSKVGDWIRRKGIGRKVIFTGHLTGEDKIDALASAEVFTLPSYSENFGMAVVEAMYAQIPVVVTKNVGVAPVVARAGAGLVVEKDEQQLAKALLTILRDNSVSHLMGMKGREVVEREFAPEAVANAFLKAYQSIL